MNIKQALGVTTAFALISALVLVNVERTAAQSVIQAGPKTVAFRDQTKSEVTASPEQLRQEREKSEAASINVIRARELLAEGNLSRAEGYARVAAANAEFPLVAEEGTRLLGQIALQRGDYRTALDNFGEHWMENKDARLDLDMALCYVRLGDVASAKRHFRDEAITRFTRAELHDLPSTLEARIQLARGVDSFLTTSGQKEALRTFDEVLRLSPSNALAASLAMRSLVLLARPGDTLPYAAVVVANGHGSMVAEAQRYVNGFPKAARERALSKAKAGRAAM